jgi:hypothetical protein
VARFFGTAAPAFLTLSATVRLPVPGLAADPQDEQRLQRQLRELEYNPDRHLPSELTAKLMGLLHEKQRLIAGQNAARRLRRNPGAGSSRGTGTGYERFRGLQEINRRLAEFTRDERLRIEEELTRTRRQLTANSVLQDREYAFCLYPANKLQRFFNHVCRIAGG